jgi:hypothetical protein
MFWATHSTVNYYHAGTVTQDGTIGTRAKISHTGLCTLIESYVWAMKFPNLVQN